ncbi:MAG: hypothetical protein ACXV3T_03140 [Halobacteriota archaeon]
MAYTISFENEANSALPPVRLLSVSEGSGALRRMTVLEACGASSVTAAISGRFVDMDITLFF